MARYGAIPCGSVYGISDMVLQFNGGGTFAKHDLVKSNGSGKIVIATTGSLIVGVALESATSSSTGVQVNATPGLQVYMENDNDGTTFAAAHVLEYADVTGTTGAMLVDTSTHSDTTAAQLFCLEYAPVASNISDAAELATVGKYVIHELVLN